jgi:hypothetical protein
MITIEQAKKDYPLSVARLEELQEFLATYATVYKEGTEEREMLEIANDAFVSFLTGRAPHSFERALEDEETGDEE